MPDLLITDSLFSVHSILFTVGEMYPGVVVITDKDANIQWVNDEFVDLTGYPLEEVRGKKPKDALQGPETDPETIQYMHDHIQAQEAFECEILNYRRDGSTYWVRLKARPIFINGELVHWIGAKHDITRQKNLEEDIRRDHEKLFESLNQLEKAVQEFSS